VLKLFTQTFVVLFPVRIVDGFDLFITFTDDYSRYGRFHRIRAMQRLQAQYGSVKIIQTDISGPFPVRTVDRFDLFITFIDDYSCYEFKQIKAEVESQYDLDTKIVI
jgi:hypothetical protein